MLFLVAASFGCRDRGRPSDSVTVRAPAPAAAFVPSGGICLDEDEEPRGIACSGGAARRSGDTLFIRASSGESTFVTHDAGEGYVVYRYLGRLTPSLHLLSVEGIETTWTEIVDGRTGVRSAVAGLPVLSPDAKRFAAVSNSLFVCEGHNRIQIWAIDDSGSLSRDWEWEPEGCPDEAPWGPADPRWRATDTLEFTRLENVADSLKRQRNFKFPQRQALLAKADTGWVFLPPSVRP